MYKKQTFFKKKKNGKKGCVVSKCVKGYVHKAIASTIEDKYLNTYVGNYTGPATMPNTGSLQECTNLLLGNAEGTRIGAKIRVKSIYLKGIISGAINAATQCHARILLVWDKTNNGGAVSLGNVVLTDLLQGDATHTVATAGVFLPYDTNKVPSRYGIIMDRTFDIQVTAHDANVTAYPMVRHIDFKKFYKRGINVQYNANNSGGNQDIQCNALYLIWLSDIALAAAQPTLQCSVKIRYEDA